MSINVIKLLFFVLVLICITAPSSVYAQKQDQVYRAKVVKIVDEKKISYDGTEQLYQKIKTEFVSGPMNGKTTTIEYAGVTMSQKLSVGDSIIVREGMGPKGPMYFVQDRYRFPAVIGMFIIFICFIAFFGGMYGIRSLLGLIFGIGVLAYYVVPRILLGDNPLFVSFTGSLFIVVVSLYIAHGFNERTSISLVSTVCTILITLIVAMVYVSYGSLFGAGSEEAVFLQIGMTATINLRGLLLGGIIIGTLGVLDDVTTAQTAAIAEIKLANPKLSVGELYKRGYAIGREHIASLVNTLVLAYVGASFPLFLLFTTARNIPLWATLSSEFVVEEIARTLVGSITLVCAVPISTYLAAHYFGNKKYKASLNKEDKKVSHHYHG